MIPATALGGALFPRPVRDGDWIGWCEWEWSPGAWSARTFDAGLPTRGAVRFDPANAQVQHRIADVLRSLGHEVGHLLPVALGGRVGDAVEVGSSCGADAPGGPCDYEPGHAQPHKTGNTRMLRPVPAARVSARLLAASVEGVEQGRVVVRGVLPEWRESPPGIWVRGDGSIYPAAVIARDDRRPTWAPRSTDRWVIVAGSRILDSGPETGPAGRAAADAAALRLRWALLDSAASDGVRVGGGS